MTFLSNRIIIIVSLKQRTSNSVLKKQPGDREAVNAGGQLVSTGVRARVCIPPYKNDAPIHVTVKRDLTLALFKKERRFMKKKKNELSERDQAILTTAEKLKALDDVTLRMIDEKVGMIRQISEMYKKEILEREREIINQ